MDRKCCKLLQIRYEISNDLDSPEGPRNLG
jgi:hypothetical protein